jgi:hypothetical protein
MKRSALNRVSKSPAARLRRELDGLWSKCITKLFRGRCAKCGWAGCHAHHLIKRRNKHARWAIMNGLLLCAGCHTWAELFPRLFTAWLGKHYEGHAEWVMEHSMEKPGTILISEMKETRDVLKQVLRRVG